MKHEIEYLRHIRDECEYVLTKSEKLTQEQFIQDETLKRAFVRSIEIIGEASKNISDVFRLKYPNIDWKKIAGMRDVLIHSYFGVDYRIVWDVIRNHIPVLYHRIKEILNE
ncbi:MAG: HepT-like ribonuclease domain-containing protein [Candidatus Hodarchaeales archaeon]